MPVRSPNRFGAAVAAAALLLAWQFEQGARAGPGPSWLDRGHASALAVAPQQARAAPAVVFVGAGDIGVCGSPAPEWTARLLDRIPGTVFTTGDNSQGDGSASDYRQCYDPTWGRHRSRTFATAGNHDWDGTGGLPYFDYFGANAGPPGRGYYSVDLGAWHIVSLNSNIAAGPGSRQYAWLEADLARSDAACTIAIWHHPLFSSGPHGGSPHMRDIWRLLDRAEAEIVLNGHDHIYERFAPQDANGRATPAGLRQFIVGTGGDTLYEEVTRRRNTEALQKTTWGVLELTLRPESYDWEFVPIDGMTFRDAGSASCIAAPAR